MVGFSKIKAKVLKRKEKEGRKLELKKEIIDQKKNLKDLLTTSYIIYGNQILSDIKFLLAKWRKENKFPVKYYTEDFIKHVLSKKKCFL